MTFTGRTGLKVLLFIFLFGIVFALTSISFDGSVNKRITIGSGLLIPGIETPVLENAIQPTVFPNQVVNGNDSINSIITSIESVGNVIPKILPIDSCNPLIDSKRRISEDVVRFDFTMVSSTNMSDWFLLNDNPGFTGREGSSTVVFHNEIYLLGGLTSKGFSNEVWKSTDGNSWTLVTSNASWSPRAWHSAIVFNNAIYLVGGRTKNGDSNEVWKSVDGINWGLLKVNTQPFDLKFSSVSQSSLVELNDRVYLIGGYANNGYPTGNVWSTNDFINWQYEMYSGSFLSRGGHSGTIYNGKIYLMSGRIIYSQDGMDVYSCDGDVFSSGLPLNWIKISTPGFDCREYASSIVYNNTLYLIAGSRLDTTLLNDIWSFDGSTWKRIASAGFTPRRGSSAIVFNGKLFFIGGYSGKSLTNEVWTLGRPVVRVRSEGFLDAFSIASNSGNVNVKEFYLDSNGRVGSSLNSNDLSNSLAVYNKAFGFGNVGLNSYNVDSKRGSFIIKDMNGLYSFSSSSFNRFDGPTSDSVLNSNGISRKPVDYSNSWNNLTYSYGNSVTKCFRIKITDYSDDSGCSVLQNDRGVSRDAVKFEIANDAFYLKQWIILNASSGFDPRFDFTSLVLNVSGVNKLFIVGGQYNSLIGAGIHGVWSTLEGQIWKRETDVPALNQGSLGSFILNNRAYVIASTSGNSINEKNARSHSSNDGISWDSFYTDIPNGIYRHALFVLNINYVQKVFAIVYNSLSKNNEVWSSFDGRAWKRETNSNFKEGTFSNFFETFVLNNKVFVITYNPSINVNKIYSSVDGVNWKLETDKPGFNSARYYGSTFVYNNKVYWFGGSTRIRNSLVNLNDLWSSDNGINWTFISSLSVIAPRYGQESVVLKGKPLIIGGDIGASNGSSNNVFAPVSYVKVKSLGFSNAFSFNNSLNQTSSEFYIDPEGNFMLKPYSDPVSNPIYGKSFHDLIVASSGSKEFFGGINVYSFGLMNNGFLLPNFSSNWYSASVIPVVPTSVDTSDFLTFAFANNTTRCFTVQACNLNSLVYLNLSDSSNGKLSSYVVQVFDNNSGRLILTVTEKNGNVISLPPGSYKFMIFSPGFDSYNQTINLKCNDKVSLNVKLLTCYGVVKYFSNSNLTGVLSSNTTVKSYTPSGLVFKSRIDSRVPYGNYSVQFKPFNRDFACNPQKFSVQCYKQTNVSLDCFRTYCYYNFSSNIPVKLALNGLNNGTTPQNLRLSINSSLNVLMTPPRTYLPINSSENITITCANSTPVLYWKSFYKRPYYCNPILDSNGNIIYDAIKFELHSSLISPDKTSSIEIPSLPNRVFVEVSSKGFPNDAFALNSTHGILNSGVFYVDSKGRASSSLSFNDLQSGLGVYRRTLGYSKFGFTNANSLVFAAIDDILNYSFASTRFNIFDVPNIDSVWNSSGIEKTPVDYTNSSNNMSFSFGDEFTRCFLIKTCNFASVRFNILDVEFNSSVMNFTLLVFDSNGSLVLKVSNTSNSFNLFKGSYKLVVSINGFNSVEQNFTVSCSENKIIDIKLLSCHGSVLYVSPFELTGNLTSNTSIRGYVPSGLVEKSRFDENVPYGNYSVQFKPFDDTFNCLPQSFAVTCNATTRVDLQCSKAMCYYNFSSNILKTKVYLNDVFNATINDLLAFLKGTNVRVTFTPPQHYAPTEKTVNLTTNCSNSSLNLIYANFSLQNYSCNPVYDKYGEVSYDAIKFELIQGSKLNSDLMKVNNFALLSRNPGFSKRSYYTTFVLNGKAFLVGGSNGNTLFNDVWSTIDGSTWKQETSNASFVPREMFSNFVLNLDGVDTAFVVGGKTSNYNSGFNEFASDVWSSVNGVTWNKVTDYAGFNALGSHCNFVLNNKVFMIPGWGSIKDSYNTGQAWSSTDGKNWIMTNGSVPFKSRIDATCFAFNGKGYVVGGYGYIPSIDDYGYSKEVWSTSDGVNWINEPNLPVGRSNSIYFVVNDKVYLFGGVSASDSGDAVLLNDVLVFNGNSWNNTGVFPRVNPLFFQGSFSLNGKLIALGSDFESEIPVYESPLNNEVWSIDLNFKTQVVKVSSLAFPQDGFVVSLTNDTFKKKGVFYVNKDGYSGTSTFENDMLSSIPLYSRALGLKIGLNSSSLKPMFRVSDSNANYSFSSSNFIVFDNPGFNKVYNSAGQLVSATDFSNSFNDLIFVSSNATSKCFLVKIS